MAINYYKKSSSLVNYYGTSGNSSREPDMRQELINTLEGQNPEIPKGVPTLLRKARRDSEGRLIPCPCVDPVTKEPDKDRFCPICYGQGFYWDESYFLTHKTLESVDVRNAIKNEIIPAGLINVPIVVFYSRYDILSATIDDKIIVVDLEHDGTVKSPVRRTEIYRIESAWGYRSDNGKLEYWKIFTHREVTKYLNPPGFDSGS